MASFTRIVRRKRARRHQKAGSARKAKQSQRSTASYDELFAACGEPGQAAPAAATDKAGA